MRPREAVIMRLWLKDHESEYDRFEYNVRVGPGRDPGPDFSPAVRRNAKLSSQLRLDAVAWRDGRPTLIEVKDFALMAAIAQVALYAAVWRAERPGETEPALLIVCSNSEPGFVNAALAANIAVQMLGPH
jgi:hypothetical protein